MQICMPLHAFQMHGFLQFVVLKVCISLPVVKTMHGFLQIVVLKVCTSDMLCLLECLCAVVHVPGRQVCHHEGICNLYSMVSCRLLC